MALETDLIEKIKEFIYKKPRSMSELAMFLDKNWRTANRYVEEIMAKTGHLKMRTFREGSRGALKIIYWNNNEGLYATDVQKELFKQIEKGIAKSDFSPFEIYQYVDPEKRTAYSEIIKDETTYDFDIKSLTPFFESAKEKILIFAGNLSFIHLKTNGKKVLEFIKDAVGRKVTIQIITNISQADLLNVEEVLSLNNGLATPLVEIRHAITPLRTYVFDNTTIRLGEVDSQFKKEGQRKGIICSYYEVRDKAWIEWIQNLFWKNFNKAIPAKRRIDAMNTIKIKDF